MPRPRTQRGLSLSADGSIYNVGDTITISVVGSSNGTTESSTQVFAQVNFDDGGALASYVSSSQTQGGTFTGAIPWTLGALNSGPGFAVAINQIIGLNPLPASTDASGTIQLLASAPGVVGASIDAGTADYFGAAVPAGISFTIVPEPTTAGLLGLGLLSLAVAGRRR